MTNVTPEARVVTVTPAIASAYLACNTRNRKVSGRNYAVVHRAIMRGEWKLNGEAIKIARDGTVLDGQHRLHAVVESGVPIQTFVIENLEPETQDTMDTGKSRSITDVLAIRGEHQTAMLAAVLRRIYIYESHGLRAATMASYPTTNHEVLAFYDANKWVQSYVAPARSVGGRARLPGSLTGLLMHVFSRIDHGDSAYFFDRLGDGENLPSDSPIYVLRRALELLADSKGATNQTYLAAITVKAWNKFRAGEPVGHLRFAPGGANPEKFPEPK